MQIHDDRVGTNVYAIRSSAARLAGCSIGAHVEADHDRIARGGQHDVILVDQHPTPEDNILAA